MKRLIGSLGQRRIGIRMLAVFCCALTLLSFLPIIGISFYNHPYYDDFGPGGQLTRQVWQERQSVWALLSAAFEGAEQSYVNWEGNYVTNYLNCIQISAISQDLCFVTTLILLLAVILSWAYFVKVVLFDIVKARASVCVIGACAAAFLSIHLVPHANEAFFWQSGGFKYTLGHALLTLLAAWIARCALCPPVAKGWRVAHAALLSLAAFLAAGSNLMTGLGAVVALFLAALYAFARQSKGRLSLSVALAVGLLGFGINVLAPGNQVRQGNGVNMNPLLAIAQALYATLEYVGQWTTLPWIATLALLAFLIVRTPPAYRFAHPALMLLGSFCVLASQLAPPVYTNIYYDSGRIVNTMYLSYCLFMMVNGIYLAGWAAHRIKEQGSGDHHTERDRPGDRGIPLAAVAAVAIALCVGCIGYGLTKMTGGASAKAWLTGQAARYDQAYRERTELLEKTDEDTVAVEPMREVPLVFMDETFSWKSMLVCLSEFYEKEVIDSRNRE